MKNITYIVIFAICFNCKAQNPILPLENWDDEQTNAYYKDLNNELNPFEGTWLYTNGNTSLEIILKKETMIFNGKYYEDLIGGEFKYVKGGIEIINTLSNLDTSEGFEHKIDGNIIYKTCNISPPSDCVDGETRLSTTILDQVTGHAGNATFHLRNVDGQDALRAYIMFSQHSSYNGYSLPKPEPSMPWQNEYLLIKQ